MHREGYSFGQRRIQPGQSRAKQGRGGQSMAEAAVSCPVYQCCHMCTPVTLNPKSNKLLSEGQEGEVGNSSNKAVLFWVSESITEERISEGNKAQRSDNAHTSCRNKTIEFSPTYFDRLQGHLQKDLPTAFWP